MRQRQACLALSVVLLGALFTRTATADALLDNLDDPLAWAGTAEKRAIGPGEAKEGKGALVMRISEGTADPNPSLSRELPKSNLSEQDVLTFWMKTSAPFDSFQIRLTDSQGTTAQNSVLNFQRRMEPGRWHWVVWPFRLYSGQVQGPLRRMVWSEVTGLTFQGKRPSHPTEVEFTIDEISTMSLKEARENCQADAENALGNRWLLWSVLEEKEADAFPGYCKGEAERLAKSYRLPTAQAELSSWQRGFVARLWNSFRVGRRPRCRLDAQVVGSFERDGYRVERVVFRSWPHIHVPANVYAPTQGQGPFPAILLFPGTSDRLFSGVYQRMAQRFVREGYVFMFVETFGTGERSIEVTANDYPEGMPAAEPWVVGLPLSGLVIFDYYRAVDYLTTRPDVDPQRIGVTGASAGGVHSLWLAALDERVKAAVPVASGFSASPDRYHRGQIWSGIPGYIRYADENGLVAATAPRPLLWIHLTGDESETEEQLRQRAAGGNTVYELVGAADAFQVRLVKSEHGYYPLLQEMALEWFNRWLKGQQTSPPEEGWKATDEPTEALACWLKEGRPKEVQNFTEFVQQRAKALLEKIGPPPQSEQRWSRQRARLRNGLRRALALPAYGERSKAAFVAPSPPQDIVVRKIALETEPGLRLPLLLLKRKGNPHPSKAVLLLHPEGKLALAETPLAEALVAKGYLVAIFEPRFTGETRWAGESAAYLGLRDHDFAQAAVKLGKPALGMWVWDIQSALQALVEAERIAPQDVSVVGWQEVGLAALFAAGLDDKIQRVVGINLLGSYYSPKGYGRMYSWGKDNRDLGGIGSLVPMVPDVLSVADIPQFASLLAPRRLLLCQPCWASGEPMNQAEAQQNFAWTQSTFSLLGAADNFAFSAEARDEEILNWLEDSAKGR